MYAPDASLPFSAKIGVKLHHQQPAAYSWNIVEAWRHSSTCSRCENFSARCRPAHDKTNAIGGGGCSITKGGRNRQRSVIGDQVMNRRSERFFTKIPVVHRFQL